jgi:hypothetical protein
MTNPDVVTPADDSPVIFVASLRARTAYASLYPPNATAHASDEEYSLTRTDR